MNGKSKSDARVLPTDILGDPDVSELARTRLRCLGSFTPHHPHMSMGKLSMAFAATAWESDSGQDLYLIEGLLDLLPSCTVLDLLIRYPI